MTNIPHIEIDGIVYYVEDKLTWQQKYQQNGQTNTEQVCGTIMLGLYSDDEQYTTFEHAGFYVHYYDHWGEGKMTLPDLVRGPAKAILKQ